MKTSITTVFIATTFLFGCSTISVQDQFKPKEERAKVAGDMQEVKLTTYPAGASCAVDRDGKTLGELEITPGFVTLKRSNFKSVDVTCSKPGFAPQMETLRTIIGDKAIGGNIGAAITLFKMTDGSYSSYEKSLFLKLKPAAFNSDKVREQYIADQLVILNAQYKADDKAIAQCKKKKKRCEKKRRKKLSALQSSYELRSTRMKAVAANIPVQANAISYKNSTSNWYIK